MAGTSGDDPMIGQTIAEKYILRRRIGSGGMGVVYEAEHAVTHRRVAVKLLSGAEQQWTPTSVQRFLREARVAAMIGHPNIIEVLDAGTLASGLPYIVLTLLEGESLSGLLYRVGALPPRDAVEIVIEVLEALKAAHARNVVHRDIKPENVFVSTTANGGRAITLLDFGISKVTAEGGAESKTLTKTGSVLGTADYMSPEQVRGDDEIDGRTDLWAVGVMLYRMVSGQLPFAGKNYNLVVVSVLTAKAAVLGEIAPKVPRALEALVAKAMEKDRNARFASANEMLEALRALLGGIDSNDDSWTQPAVDVVAVTGRVSTDSVADLGQAATVVTGAEAAVNAVRPKVDTLAAQTAPTRGGGARGNAARRNAAIGVAALLVVAAVTSFSLRAKRTDGAGTATAAPTHAVVGAPIANANALAVPNANVEAPAVERTGALEANVPDAVVDAGAIVAPTVNATPNANASANANANGGLVHGPRVRNGARGQAVTSSSGSATANAPGNTSATATTTSPANNGQATRPRTGFDEL
jgi:serine/threonine-protein kinase